VRLKRSKLTLSQRFRFARSRKETANWVGFKKPFDVASLFWFKADKAAQSGKQECAISQDSRKETRMQAPDMFQNLPTATP